jgi:hypothetical protein
LGARKVDRIYVVSTPMRLALLVAQLLWAMRAAVKGIAVSSSLVVKGLSLWVCG